ncbi:PEP-CTERM sorting domain-containing protein [Humisphaera borealis]|uniref:PEP-CTERM sorting domain-containing protein n=1 Tax=Humisphaera borealis TaxID=2807512 RepID=A0A7M2WXE4_9BACT|nr:PEP-CTERM sorting domain-containing protein [Humisphaera borealis]QOV90165.1 PEP-CTERM sorting domain-containing protein [Humisphaera borealis]
MSVVLSRTLFRSALPLVALLLGSPAVAAPQPLNLTGVAQYDGWGNFNATTMPGYGTYPGASAWSSGSLGSNLAGSGDAVLNRIAGSGSSGPYVASSTIYFAGAGTLSVTDASPVANLKTVVFQIDLGPGSGSGFTAEPTLTYNGITAGPTPRKLELDGGIGALDPDGNPATTTTLLYQWDLTGITGITSYGVQWSNTQHTQLYAMRLDQSDTVTAVPEPAALAPLLLGTVALLRRRSRNSRPAAL